MKQWFIRGLWAILGLVLLCFVAAVLAQNQLADKQNSSLKLLQEPKPLAPIARDGTAALYLLPYRTENAQQVYELFEKHQHYLLWGGDEPAALAERNLGVDLIGEADFLKCATPSKCVEKVAQNAAQYQQWHNQYQVVLNNIADLNQYDGYEMAHFAEKNWGDENMMVQMRLPAFQILVQFPRIQAAMNWHNNQREQAVLNMCAQADLARKLQNTTHQMLIDAMISSVMLNQSADYLAYFMQQQPELAHRLPESCVRHLQPQTERTAQVMCAAMKGEFLFQKNTFQRMDMEKWYTKLFYNADMTITQSAPSFAHTCSPLVQQQMISDEMVDEFVSQDKVWEHIACVRNVAGCVLLYVAETSYTVYPRRLQDLDMKLRAFQAALTLAKLPEAERKNQAENVLQQWSSPYRKLWLSPTQQDIEFEWYAPKNGEREVGTMAVKL